MAIAEQFAGLQMDQLIGAPLRAAADASTLLANSTADFINRVGFDREGKVRNVAFGYQKRSANDDGTSNLDELVVNVPMLAIVPIPNLQVDEVNILFDMEVKQSEKQESSLDIGAKVSGSLNLGVFKVNVTGSVSAHQSNTRSSDNSAKYHVDVRATNHGTPEGLARVLDMMAANVAPMLVGSTLKDGDGNDLSAKAKSRAERLKALRQEISQIENRLSAARQGLDSGIAQLKRIGDTQHSCYQSIIMNKINELEAANDKAETSAETKAANEKTIAARNQEMDEVNQSWITFQTQAGDIVKMIASAGGDNTDNTQGNTAKVSDLFGLKMFKEDKVQAYGSGETYYDGMLRAQKNAVDSQKSVNDIETELLNKRAEYSDAMSTPTGA